MKTSIVVFVALLGLAVAQKPFRFSRPTAGQFRFNGNEGRYSSDSDGQYRPDNSGAYNGDNGQYRPDNSGQYVHQDVKYEHIEDKYKHTADQFGPNGGNQGGFGPDGGNRGGSGGVGSSAGSKPGFKTGSKFPSGSSPSSSSSSSGFGSSAFGKGVTSGSGSKFGSGLQKGNAAGLYDNRNYAIIRKIENVKKDGYYYLYETENGILAEEQGKLANVGTDKEGMRAHGFYTYTGPDAIVYTVKYTADENGFLPEGAHIPEIPEPIQRALAYQRAQGTL